MSSASVSPHGFVAVRGRAYRPAQVDAYVTRLSRERDEAWERAARLTVLAKDMEAEAERLREAVTGLAPQTYETLGERAQRILALGQEEAAAVLAAARDDAERVTAAAEEAMRELDEAAHAYADAVRAEADERARHRLLADRATADEIRIAARRDVKERRGEALAALREMRERTAGMLADLEKEHAERWDAAERDIAGGEAAADAHHDELTAAAEERLSKAERAFAEAEEAAWRIQEEAQTRAAELLTGARAREDAIGRETERVLRLHGEQWDEVRAHMDHVRNSLAALTGRAARAEGAP
ncbi:cellulose-binding protein [Streptomyces sp. PSKA54]|uniref:Cellulose-binding protein n=1 Tax=Streptomyces himalayensis subsp. aureolus TaxID=2758039 RepID=A0A7W2HJ04_9ACTN|nr:cellulose-binding protein [Streptomyces himalayensis]MBA4865364.1 cellulose-binding protein [Streptomyces himalayensis subsp. aureolus]